MTLDEFWQILTDTSPECGDSDEHVERIEERLLLLTPGNICDFHYIFWELWGEANQALLWDVVYIIYQGCSDDGFAYFLGWLVLQGREFYEEVVANPEVLAESLLETSKPECEFVFGVAQSAYERKTGEELPEKPRAKGVGLKGKLTPEEQLDIRFADLIRRVRGKWARVKSQWLA